MQNGPRFNPWEHLQVDLGKTPILEPWIDAASRYPDNTELEGPRVCVAASCASCSSSALKLTVPFPRSIASAVVLNLASCVTEHGNQKFQSCLHVILITSSTPLTSLSVAWAEETGPCPQRTRD